MRLDVSVLVLVVDDELDVEALFRQQFRRDLRAQHAARRSRHHDHGLRRSLDQAIESGASGLLTKPIDFALLRQKIDTRLEKAG
jgi:hypothetical protein